MLPFFIWKRGRAPNTKNIFVSLLMLHNYRPALVSKASVWHILIVKFLCSEIWLASRSSKRQSGRECWLCLHDSFSSLCRVSCQLKLYRIIPLSGTLRNLEDFQVLCENPPLMSVLQPPTIYQRVPISFQRGPGWSAVEQLEFSLGTPER